MEIKNDNHILNIDPITDFGKKGGEDFVQQKNPLLTGSFYNI